MTVSHKVAGAVTEEKTKKRGKGYITQVKEELRKVSWPTREELKTSTKIVLVSIFAFGFGFYFVDLALRGALQAVTQLAKLITG